MNLAIKQAKARRKYDKEFKRHAVEHWLSSHKSGPQIAQDLGINPNLLYRWRDRLAAPPGQKGGGGLQGAPAALEVENARLRRANEELRQQRDILKKTLGILSEPPGSATNGSTR
jgi:transposase